MEPWQSWALAGVVGAGLFLYYSSGTRYAMKLRQSSDNPQAPTVTTQHGHSVLKRRPDRAGGSRPVTKQEHSLQQGVSANSKTNTAAGARVETPPKTKKGKDGKHTTKTPSASALASPSTLELEDHEEAAGDDENWAAQLAANKSGISLNRSETSAPRKRPVKHAVASDWSERTAGNVSDMLEPAPAAPGVLRVTGEQPQERKKHIPKAEPATETKKQRQNRRKAEEKRLLREEDEKRRQVLLEEQRRTARESRGEPARNGVKSSPTVTNAWPSKANGTGGEAPGATQTQLLDTFEHHTTFTTSSNDSLTNAATPITTASSTLEHDLPSEGAQLGALSDTTTWNEVSSKKKKGKRQGPAVEEVVSGTFTNGTSEENNPKPGSRTEAPVKKVPAVILPAKPYGFGVLQGHPDDSDWAA